MLSFLIKDETHALHLLQNMVSNGTLIPLPLIICSPSSFLASCPFLYQQTFHDLNYSFLVLALFLFGARQFLLLLGISCLYYSGASQTSPCQMLQYYLHCKCLRFTSFLKKHFNHTRFVIISQITMLICESVIYQHGCFPLLYASCIWMLEGLI